MNPEYLHLYQCRSCKSTATTAVKMPFRCQACSINGRYGGSMVFLWSTRITTDQQRADAAKGIVFTRPESLTEPLPAAVRCRAPRCLNYKPEEEMVHLPGIGKFCSQACAEAGQKDYEAFMERLRNLKEERPWLKWPKKAS